MTMASVTSVTTGTPDSLQVKPPSSGSPQVSTTSSSIISYPLQERVTEGYPTEQSPLPSTLLPTSPSIKTLSSLRVNTSLPIDSFMSLKSFSVSQNNFSSKGSIEPPSSPSSAYTRSPKGNPEPKILEPSITEEDEDTQQTLFQQPSPIPQTIESPKSGYPSFFSFEDLETDNGFNSAKNLLRD